MELPKLIEDEALLFAKSLFSYLFSSHPLFKDIAHLFRNRKDSAFFTDEIGRAVMQVWISKLGPLKLKFSCDFPKFIKNNSCFGKYLEYLLKLTVDHFAYPYLKVIVYSGVLLELISFLYRRRITHYAYSAPYHWLYMFKICSGVEFFEKGGWEALEIAATNALKGYDENYVQKHLKWFWTSKFDKEHTGIGLKVYFRDNSVTRDQENLDDAFDSESPMKSIRSFDKSAPSSTKRYDIVKGASKGIASESSSMSPGEQTKILKPTTSKGIISESSSISSNEKTKSIPMETGLEDIASKSEPTVASISQADDSRKETETPLDLRKIPIRQPRSPAKLRHKMQNKKESDRDTPLDLSKKF